MRKVTVRHGRVGRRDAFQRRLAWSGLITIFTLIFSLFPQVAGLPVPTASAHNLDSGFVYMFFDPATQADFDAFIAANPPGTPLLQDGQTVGIIIKVVPSDGTNTGVGGYVDFYVPNGVQVTDVAYLTPNGSGGYDKAPIKGQSPIAIGDGPIGTNCTAALGTPPPLTLGQNILGTTAQAVATTTGCHNGTIAGVYADTGIFYATDPRTARGSYSGGKLTNNSGDTVGLRTAIGTVPNLWDAQQLAAYGIAGSSNPAFPGAPIVDPNGRGNAPWGNASAVAGPQSGYAWEFDMGVCGTTANPCDPAEMKAASSQVGPWQRIKYPGSQISKDQPGLKSTVLGYVGVDGSQVGYALASYGAVGPRAPLAPTVAQDDATSPKTIRWAIGQLTYLKPEYVWVQFKVIDRSLLATANGNACPVFYGDTFGGDAGGLDTGKDHIWRYYDPNGIVWNACLGGGKPDNVPAVKVGDTFQYHVKVYNYGLIPLTNVVVKDLLSSGVSFVSAVPAQNSGPNPLQWTVGTLPVGGKFEATVTVKATGTGVLTNALLITSSQGSQTIYEQTPSGAIPILTQTKSVAPTAVAPGGTVTYTIVSKNIGTGPTASPVVVTEYLPSGFTYAGLTSVTANGASYTGTTAVNQTNPNQPVFTVPTSIQAGKELRLVFTATAGSLPGSYCNSYQLREGSTSFAYTTGSLACVAVGGNAVSDTIWRDWDGDGTQDPDEQGIAGVQVCANPGNICATTDANGHYLISGLVDGTYTVAVTNPPAGYTATYDLDGAGTPNTTAVSLSGNTVRTDVDFGYEPRGVGSIGDKVFEDIGNDGAFNAGTDAGIPDVTVWLYADADGDGVITPGVDPLVAETASNASGDYAFTNLAEGFSYLVKVNQADLDIKTYFDTTYPPSAAYQISTLGVIPSPNLAGSDTDNDFGFWRALPGSIGDQVFIDSNANGVYDAGTDTVLPNVTVSLYKDTNGNGVLDAGEPLLHTTATGPDGKYLFEDLGPGAYIVDVDQGDPDLPGGLTATQDPIATTLTAGQNKDTLDFPFVSVLTKAVDKTTALPGATLTFTITPYYPGPQLLSSALIQDVVPAGTAFQSAGQGGQLSPAASEPATRGEVTTVTTGQGIYSINSNTPQYRTWDGSAFGAQTASVNLADTPNILIGAASPTRNEKIVVDIIANNPEVQAMRWNGTAWVALAIPPATGTVGALSNLASNVRTLWGGAVAYEQLSGDAMLIWNNTTTAGTNRLTWNTWNGTAWGANADISTTGEPRQLRLAAKPSSDEMILVTSNDTAYDYARVWNGSAWGAAQTLENASGGSQTAIQVAYEQQSGDALVVYGKAVATDVKLYYRTYSGGVWSAEQSLDPAAQGVTTGPQWVSIAADPNDNEIVVGVVTSGGKTWLAAWDGSAWGDPALATATSLSSTALNVGVAFETISGQALAAYGVTGATTVAYRTWTPEAGWSEEQIGPDIIGSPNVISLSPSPNSDRIMLSTNDSNSDAQYTVWDGDAWGTPTVAGTNTGGTVNQPVLFLWDRQQPPSSTTDLTAGPTTVLDGGAFTVQMTLRATKRVTGVTPGALTITNLSGNTATATCGSPSPASQTVPANVPTTFTWTCTAASAATVAELSFAASATGTYSGVPGGSYSFAAGTSNSIQFLALGDRGTVTWNLGANTARVDGVSSDPGAALCPAQVDLYPTADTYIAKGNATTWYGLTTPVITRPADATSLKYALFKFDLSGLAGKTIKSAELALYVTSARSSAHYDQVYRMVTPWTEGASAADGATWNDPNGTGAAGVWASTGGVFGASDYYGATMYGMTGPELGSFYQYTDIRVLVDAWVNGGVTNNGLVLISTGTDNRDGKYAAREATGTTTDPVLRVTYLVSTPGGCGGGTPQSTVLNSAGDTYIDKANPAVNYGEVTTLLTRPADSTKLKYTLLWFDGDEIPPGATINSATLSVVVATAKTNHVDEVHVMTRPWYEVAASWNDNDATGTGDWASGTFGSGDYNATSLGTITPSTTGAKTLDVTSAVNDWANNGVPDRGLVLISTGTDAGDAKYRSREDGTATNRPKITVNWTLAGNPGPSTTVSLSAAPMLASSNPTRVKVVMTVSGAGSFSSFTANAPANLDVSSGGLVYTKFSGPTPASATVSPGSPATFTYEYDVTPGGLPGSVTFAGRPTSTGAIFVAGLSNSVLVTPPLTYTATVNNPAGVPVVENTATIQAKEPDVQLTPDVCYAVADSINNTTSDNDILVSWNRSTGAFADVGTGTGTTHVEAAAWNLDQTVLYTTNRDATVAAGSDRFGTINATTGVYTAIGRLVSTANPLEGALGNFTVLDVDGLSFDPITGKLYAVHRREDATNGNTLLDVLFQINPATGFHVEDAYGAGVDYVVLRTDLLPTPLYDVDDIAFNPLTGELFAIANDSTTGVGDKDRLIKINKATGALVDIGRITNAAGGAGVDDMEGLSFLGNGTLDGTTGNTPGSPNDNSLWRIDTTTAVATKISAFPSHGDYEALACKDGEVQTGDTVIPPTSSNTTQTALTASIGDYVWDDLDGDGVQDAGELPLAGVQVCATDGTQTFCDTTDGDGHYRIFGLSAGSWTVTLDLTSTPAGYQPTTPTSLSVTLAANQQYSDADFGLRPPGTASIGDTVCIDAAANGCDAGDTGLPFITVKLYRDANNNGVVDAGDIQFATTTTDADGKYLFAGLYGGDYLVAVDENSPVTSPYGGDSTLAVAMNLVSGTNPHDVTLSNGQAYLDADFGYQWNGSIGDYVWWDADTQGDQDEAAPIAGAVVLLYLDVDGNGLLEPWNGDYQIGIDFTDASGAYLFDSLPPGNYLVDVYEDSLVTGGVRDVVPTTQDVVAVSLAAGQNLDTADFGYYQGARVEGNVFHDADRNGLFDASETGLRPVSVTLTGTDMFGAPITQTVDTDASGHFVFIVPEGNYTLTYDMADVLAIDPTLGDQTTPIAYTFHAFPGADWHPVFDFGVDNTGKIGDTVWNDASNPGVQDPGEPGLAGVTVMLYEDNNNDGALDVGDTFLAADVTDTNGHYLFEGLADGAYIVVVNAATVPADFGQTYDNAGPLDGTGQADISGGAPVDTVDFGYRYAPVGGAALYTIDGRVYNDANNNSNDDGETGFAGVDVTVVCQLGTAPTVTYIAHTDTNGDWAVAGIAGGSVCTVLDADESDLPRTDYVATETPGTPVTVTDNVTGLDFGYNQHPGSISGTVCAGGVNGVCGDEGETSLAGAVITLTWAGPDGILGTGDDITDTQTTPANGTHSFTGLQPGLYSIVQTNPAGYISLTDRDGGNPDNITVFSLGMGQNLGGQDFIEAAPTGIHFLGLQTIPSETSIQLSWQVTPVDGSGLPRFNVWRSVPDGAWKRLTVELLEPVSAAGDVLEYSYVDTAVETGVTYLYRLELEDGTLIGPWQVKASLARHFFYLPFMRR